MTWMRMLGHRHGLTVVQKDEVRSGPLREHAASAGPAPAVCGRGDPFAPETGNPMSSKPAPEGHYVKLPNRHRIHYLDKGKGPILVWLHGSGSGACGHSNFKGNYPYFADNGYRNIVIDHLGYGYSDKPDNIEYPIELFVECVKQTLDQIGLSH